MRRAPCISRCGVGHLLASFVALWLAAAPTHGQCQYEVTVIQALPCPFPFNDPPPTIGTGINELGHVVGYYYHCGGAEGFEAFLYTPETGLVTLDRPPDVSSALAADVNDDGMIVGTYERAGVGDRAFVYESGVYTELAPEPPGLWSQGTAINNTGQAVGYRSIGDGINPYNAFTWSAAGGFTDLGVMNGPNSSAADVNEAGDVIGWTGNGGSVSEAFLWQNGTLTLMGSVPSGFTSRPYGMSENGIVVGDGRIPMEGSPVGAPQAFRWQDGGFTLLGTLPDHAWSRASEISPDGWQIVGRSWNVGGNSNISHAFLWQNGVLHDLNQLISPDANVIIIGATAINSSGYITGGGSLQSAVVGVLLRPLDVPVGDIDRDCLVGVEDLMILLDDFGQTGSPADLNNNGVVNVLDLIILLLNFG